MIVLLDSSYISFVKEKMQLMDSGIYTDDDFEAFQRNNNQIIGYKYHNRIVAFACIMSLQGATYFVYSWSEPNFTGKKGLILGIDYVNKHYEDVIVLEDTLSHSLYKKYLRRRNGCSIANNYSRHRNTGGCKHSQAGEESQVCSTSTTSTAAETTRS